MEKNEVLNVMTTKDSQHVQNSSNSEKLSQNSNIAHDYTGTLIGKLCSKSSKNFLLVLTILIIISLYYFYVQWNLVIILSKTNSGLDYKFWKHENLGDKHFLRGFIYFTVFHIFFFLFSICFYKTITTSPGQLSEEYLNVFSLKNKLQGNIDNSWMTIEDVSFLQNNFTDEEIREMFHKTDLDGITILN
jgi:hypothetical protein